MEIIEGYGREELVIGCDLITAAVVTRDDDGNKIVAKAGLNTELKLGYHPKMPEDCPLTKPLKDRGLGDFATCKQCELAILKEDDQTES